MCTLERAPASIALMKLPRRRSLPAVVRRVMDCASYVPKIQTTRTFRSEQKRVIAPSSLLIW